MNFSASFSKRLSSWAKTSTGCTQGMPVTINRMDQGNKTFALEDFFFVDGPDAISASRKSPITMEAQETICTGCLRNSFYPELFIKHSLIQQTQFSFKASGRFVLKLEAAVEGQPVQVINERLITPPKGTNGTTPYTTTIDFELERDVPKNARLFWSAQALSDDATIHDAAWEAIAPKDTSGRMLVVMRTFGRTDDIVKLLQSFHDEAKYSPAYANMLSNTLFAVLDTSSDVTPEHYEAIAAHKDLNTFVFKGPNMGGGGNMSQVLLAIEDAVTDSGIEVNELLLLDDDLLISLETLNRHWAATLFRSDKTVFTLPVFMKSEPRRMWEDGGLWGRFIGKDSTPNRTDMAPSLLRHGLEFNGFDHLDTLARPHYPEYSTFIFLSVPYSLFQSLGYPVAVFLRGDDIEYSLRNVAAGGRTMSNPNLTAWHEPAHSYAQEYMSIAHGVMINMSYGQDKADDFVSFFQQRALAHLSIGDDLGLALYAEILRDLVGRKTFLEHGFTASYIQKLKFFKAFDAEFEYLTESTLQGFEAAGQHKNEFTGWYHFLYNPVEGNPSLGRVILSNPHTDTYRAYLPHAPEQRLKVAKAASDLFQMIDAFATNFDAIHAHYTTKLAETRTRAYWEEEMALTDGSHLLAQG